MAELVNDVSTGRTRVAVEHVYPFGQTLAVLEKAGTRNARGKLVVKVC
jgi:NADPH:quinone reductase-like Zn-dependent oxidoreductase